MVVNRAIAASSALTFTEHPASCFRLRILLLITTLLLTLPSLGQAPGELTKSGIDSAAAAGEWELLRRVNRTISTSNWRSRDSVITLQLPVHWLDSTSDLFTTSRADTLLVSLSIRELGRAQPRDTELARYCTLTRRFLREAWSRGLDTLRAAQAAALRPQWLVYVEPVVGFWAFPEGKVKALNRVNAPPARSYHAEVYVTPCSVQRVYAIYVYESNRRSGALFAYGFCHISVRP